MAWTDAARQAALEARKMHGKVKFTLISPPRGSKARVAYAHALRAQRAAVAGHTIGDRVAVNNYTKMLAQNRLTAAHIDGPRASGQATANFLRMQRTAGRIRPGGGR